MPLRGRTRPTTITHRSPEKGRSASAASRCHQRPLRAPIKTLSLNPRNTEAAVTGCADEGAGLRGRQARGPTSGPCSAPQAAPRAPARPAPRGLAQPSFLSCSPPSVEPPAVPVPSPLPLGVCRVGTGRAGRVWRSEAWVCPVPGPAETRARGSTSRLAGDLQDAFCPCDWVLRLP